MKNKDAKVSLSKQVSDQILKNISDKIWQPGEQIPTEKKLAQIYSVSRITVREAIRQLVSLGILKTIQGSGTYVCEYNSETFIAPAIRSGYLYPVTKEDILNILDVRMIEIIVVGLAAQRATEDDIAVLESIQKRIAANPKSTIVHSRADVDFHMQICRMTGNPFMIQVCQTIYDALRKVMPTMSQIMGSDYALQYHTKLIDTIRNHYAHEAKAIMEEHLNVTINAIQKVPGDSPFFASVNGH